MGSIDNSGSLNASGSGSGAWVEGNNTNLLEPDSKDGIEVDTIADNGSGSVTMNSALDLNGYDLKSSSYGNVWDLRTSSTVGGGKNRAFSLEINDDGSSDNGITWQRAGNEDAAFRVVDRTNSNDLLTVNDGGDVDIHAGNLDLNGNNVETSSGGMTVTTKDKGNLTLDPGGNNELRLSNQSTSSSGSLLARDGSGNVVEASGTTLSDVGGGGSGAWVEGDNTNLLEPDTKDGIEVDTIADNGSTSVTMNATSLDLNGTMITDTSGNISLTTSSGNFIALGGDILSDTYNIKTGTGTGTKIATATDQLLAFYGASPVTQQTGPSQLTDDTDGTTSGTLDSVSSTGDDSTVNSNFASLASNLAEIRSALESYGLLGTGTPG